MRDYDFFNTENYTEEEAKPPVKVKYLKRELGLSSITGGLTYSLDVIIYLVLSVITVLILKFVNLPETVEFYIQTIISPIAITLTALVIVRCRKVGLRTVCPAKTRPKYFLLAAALAFGLLFVGTLANAYVLKVLESFGYDSSSASYMPDMSGAAIIPAIIFIAIIPAVFEEFLVRGIMLNCAEQSMGSVRAVLVTGFCFALLHGSAAQTVHQFFLGCALALLANRSHSILPGMFVHFLNNLFVIIISVVAGEADASVMEGLTENELSIIGLVILLAIAAAIGSVVMLVRDKNGYNFQCRKGGVKSFFAAASVGIAIMAIMWIMELFV
ncbi:MAG: CPBP family intramembrane metalloprotease [Clostridia bacterium]|nr:CPBP family intramembrane metalloprotease [Clostridia bacterium]